MCPVCGCGIGHHTDCYKPWIVQHMIVSPTRGLIPADEVLCHICYIWYAKTMDNWRRDPAKTETRRLTAIGGNF